MIAKEGVEKEPTLDFDMADVERIAKKIAWVWLKPGVVTTLVLPSDGSRYYRPQILATLKSD